MFGQDRNELRQYFFASWQKYRAGQPLEPLERQIVQVILDHPEYQPIFNSIGEDLLDRDYHQLDRENPFLHLSLHLSLREQISTNRPKGIKQVYLALLHREHSQVAAEHAMLPILRDCLWQFQQSGKFPGDQAYLERLQSLLRCKGLDLI